VTSDTFAANPTRELAAIMFSDIVGYTAIMGRDEHEGLRAVREHREHLRTMLPRFNGRLIGEIGDGTLSSFHSAVDAVNCARELQANLAEDPELRLRIGIHVGDVVFTDKTVLGDGVNIASRIHELAPPGGCCISERVYEEIRNKPEFHVQDLGEKHLKNVARPIRAYALTAADGGGPRSSRRLAADAGHSKRRKIVSWTGAMLIVVLVAALSTWRWRALLDSWRPSAPSAGMRSIAVLPLENLSGDPAQEYFADGMTDELITDLAKISGLRVISRTSVMKFKGEHREQLPEIAKALNVNTIVEGSVLRVGDKVRITAQLIDASTDKHLWADSYERDTRDVLTLQDEVASTIAEQIDVELTPNEQARFASARPVNPQAYEAYLKGRFYMGRGSFSGAGGRKAQEQFEQAIKLDPKFALAYTGLADLYGYSADNVLQPAEVVPKQRAATEKALQLDDSLAEAHASLAMVKIWNDYDWAGAEREFRRAIELNPSYALAHDQYGWLLMYEGRYDASLAEMRRASELDPLSALFTNNGALPLMYQAKYQAAKEQVRKALELDPGSAYAHYVLGWIDIEAGKFKEATSALEKARKMDPIPYYVAWLGYAYAAAGERRKAQAIIVELEQASSKQWVSPFATALIYLGLGEKRQALDGLEKAYDARSQWLTLLKVDKMFDPLRSDPRFIALQKKVGLDK
jgi:adenylate cyclase